MKAVNIESEIQRYLDCPYTRELVREDDGTWFARILEFPGCMTVGDTREEALEMLDDAMVAWLEAKLEDHEAIPEPLTADDFSGRFVVRVTKTLHRDLVRAAERNSVSLNQFVITLLARGVGFDTAVNGLARSKRSDTKIATLREFHGDRVTEGAQPDLQVSSYLRRKKGDSGPRHSK